MTYSLRHATIPLGADMIPERYFAVASDPDTAEELAKTSPGQLPIPQYYKNIPGIVELPKLSIPQDTAIRGIMAYIVGTTSKYPARYRRLDHTCITWSTWASRCSCSFSYNWWLSIESQQGSNRYSLSIELAIPAWEFRATILDKIGRLSSMTTWTLERFIANSQLARPN